MAQVEFLTLSEANSAKLDAPITLKEVQLAISSLQPAKTPGPDGLPVEFYKTNSEALAPQFHELLLPMLEAQSLPPSMSEAVIVVIPKPRKDPELCESYRPISLLNVDAKIVTKILANRLNSVILSLVHGDQTGFLPGKGTDINLRRLYTNISHATATKSPGVVASLDAEKAFDSVEWEFLWQVLERFNFGPKFISWVKLMYANPTARVRTNSTLSSPFNLHKGTRQGCPLSPGLFALAIQPLAILIRSSMATKGIEVGPLRKQISLYADDALLYLPDASDSLEEALLIIDRFGSFSGIRINWTKSILFPLTSPPLLPPSHIPLQPVSKFRYLGIEVQKEPSCYLTDNVYPILQELTRCLTWKSLHLTPVGRINLLKMTFLPKFLYVFKNTSVPIPNSFFQKLDQVINFFIWAGLTPRVAKTALQLPLSAGGLALPCFKQYYWAAVLVTVSWWFTQSRNNTSVSVNLEAAILESYSALSNLVFRGQRAQVGMTVPMRTTIKVWEQLTAKLNPPNAISPYTPLWGNPRLPHLLSITDPAIWARYKIKIVQHIMPAGRLLSYDELKHTFQLPAKMFFCYLLLRHTIQAQFPTDVRLESHMVERFLISASADRILSSLYLRISCGTDGQGTKLFNKWKVDVPSLTDDDWEKGIQQYIPLMISARDRYIQLKFLHRAYYTPQRLARIYPTHSDKCPKCKNAGGNVLSCNLVLSPYSTILEGGGAVYQLDWESNHRT